MDYLRAAVTYISPIFLVTSPVTSYTDQILSIHRNRSSSGFSLDIPLIMLTASIAKVFYWFGVYYDRALLIQACVMIVVQLVLLRIALSNRASSDAATDLSRPFAPARSDKRPYDFWQWRPQRPYWAFLAYYAVTLGALQLLLGTSSLYNNLIGYSALAVEATLPLPQIMANHRNRSCKGFRLSVLINWLIGDVMKMSFFFLSESTIPWAFKICGLFQMACDMYLGRQYLQFGSGEG